MKKVIAGLVLLTLGMPVWAATRIVVLSVPGMNCAACPITVKKALDRVPGVSKVEVRLQKREVTVTFDDALASVEALTLATRDAGYPSSQVGSAK
jgi:periplasmic mercuric ion binding protein